MRDFQQAPRAVERLQKFLRKSNRIRTKRADENFHRPALFYEVSQGIKRGQFTFVNQRPSCPAYCFTRDA